MKKIFSLVLLVSAPFFSSEASSKTQTTTERAPPEQEEGRPNIVLEITCTVLFQMA